LLAAFSVERRRRKNQLIRARLVFLNRWIFKILMIAAAWFPRGAAFVVRAQPVLNLGH